MPIMCLIKQKIQDICEISLVRQPVQIHMLLLGLRPPPPRVYKKLFRIPAALVRQFNVRLIIHLDDRFVFEWTTEEALMIGKSVTYIISFLVLL